MEKIQKTLFGIICNKCGIILFARIEKYKYKAYGRHLFLCPCCNNELNIYKRYAIKMEEI